MLLYVAVLHRHQPAQTMPACERLPESCLLCYVQARLSSKCFWLWILTFWNCRGSFMHSYSGSWPTSAAKQHLPI